VPVRELDMWTKSFWKAAAERAINTFLQVFVASISVGAAINEVDWLTIASVAGVATLISVAKSIIVNTATGNGPSFTDAEQTVGKDEFVVHAEVL